MYMDIAIYALANGAFYVEKMTVRNIVQIVEKIFAKFAKRNSGHAINVVSINVVSINVVSINVVSINVVSINRNKKILIFAFSRYFIKIKIDLLVT